jgi:PKD repeat protein
MSKIHTLQDGYQTGDLSLYPEAIDNKETLYEASNNSVTILKQSLSYTALSMVVESTDNFPEKGVIKVSNKSDSKNGELIYYFGKTPNTFKGLIRGFAGSLRSPWNINSTVSNAVSAEHHNSIKDAIIKLEVNLGLKNNPDENSLNGILKAQENRFLITKPIFRAYPLKGSPPLTVRFQGFSTGPIVKYFWDFGDGNTSSEKNPTHVYYQEGSYTVELNVVGSQGGQGIVTKNNYISVSEDEKPSFFYVNPMFGKKYDSGSPTLFEFVDQTDGDVKERIWNFGGEGFLVRKLYRFSLDNQNSDYSILKLNNKILDQITNKHKCILIGGQNKLIKDILDIRQSNGIEIKIEKISESFPLSKVGFFIEDKISQYTELDPNIHVVYFIYTNEELVSPSIFILFKSQLLKKYFLKETITIQ